MLLGKKIFPLQGNITFVIAYLFNIIYIMYIYLIIYLVTIQYIFF